MSSAGNINNLPKGMTQAEFEQLLEQSVFIEGRAKKNVLSIFAKLAGDDAELSAEEWSGFVAETDTDGSGDLSKKETGQIGKAVKNKANTLYKQSKDAVVAFFNIVKNFIEGKTRQNGSSEVLYAQPNQHRAKSSTKGTFQGGWIEHDQYNSSTYEEWLANNGYQFNEEVANELEKQSKRHNDMNGYCATAFMISASDTTAVSKKRFNEAQEEQANNIPRGEEDNDNENILNGELRSNKLFNNMAAQGSAYQYASELANNPYFKEIPHNIVETMDLKSLPKGCVIVYDGHYKEDRVYIYKSSNNKYYNEKTNKEVQVTASQIRNDNGRLYYVNDHPHGHIAVTDGTGKDSGGGHYNIAAGKQATHIRVFIPIKIPDEAVS